VSKTLLCALTVLSFLFSASYAQESIIGSEDAYSFNTDVRIPDDFNDETQVRNFFSLEGAFDVIGKSKFKRSDPFNGQDVRFNRANIDLFYVKMLSCCDAIMAGIGYGHTYLDWNENPFFNETDFNTINVSLGGYTKRFCHWLWKAAVTAEFSTKKWDFADYTLYNATLWGRYGWDNCFCNDLGLNLGFIARAGLEKEWWIPLVGLDYKWGRWELNAIYPVNMALIYHINCNWSAAVAGRIWDVRHRVGPNENFSNGIFEYRNSGVEFALTYEVDPILSVNAHVGSTLGNGQLRIYNQNGGDRQKLRFGAAPYFGSAITLRF
jgi:hypothetical protein